MKPRELLQSFSASPYRLDIDEAFLSRFFEDRRLVAGITKKHLKQEGLFLSGVDHAVRMGGTELWGQSTIEENYALNCIVRALKPSRVIEIGLFRGQTALTINRALDDRRSATYTGIDIDPHTVAIVGQVLTEAGLHSLATVQLEDSAKAIAAFEAIDFAFIDGDHSWKGVVADFVGTYNRLNEGGVIALHDVGSPKWGWSLQDPGRLLHQVLPSALQGHAEIYWLDSMCRELTMHLLSPVATGTNKYFDTLEKSLSIAQITLSDTVRGWGGLGFVYKTDATHRLDYDEILGRRPEELIFEALPPVTSRLKRYLLKAINHLP